MEYEISDIIQVIETNDVSDLNSYLNLGWILMHMPINQYDNASFVLGWPKENGEIKHPDENK